MLLPPRPVRRALLATVAVVVVAAGCSSSDGPSGVAAGSSPARPSTSTTTPTDGSSTTTAGSASDADGFPSGWVAPELDWSRCDVADRAECATLTVPLDWAAPDGATIDLALARRPATGDRIGSLLINPGGPGGSGLDTLGADIFSSELRARFDIVSWDPRGVGESTRVECGDRTAADLLTLDPDPDDTAEQSALDQAASEVSAECAESDLALLSHIGTDEVARDLEGIRRALGDEPLNYLGFSYGTLIGQKYAQMFPDEVRAMVLDGVVDPALGYTDFLLGQTVAFDDAFEDNARRCADAGASKCGVRDLGAAYDEVHAAVEEDPLGSGTKVVGPAELAIAAVMTSYADNGWTRLGPALAAARDGDGSKLRRLADAYYDFGSYGTYAGVECTDTPPPDSPAAYRQFADEARRLSPRFGGSVANELLPCATWPVDPVGVAAPITAPDAPPILVVGNLRDAATPYENAVTVASTLESGVLVTVDVGGHTAYGSDECATKVVDAYLVDLDVPDADPRCT